MLQSVLGSFMSLFWAFVLLFITFYLFSIATIQGMANYLSSDEGQAADEELRRQIVTYFGSVFKAMMSYHMATSGGKEWALYYEVLVQASEMTAALFALVVAFTQIALLNIMTGIFVETAMKLAKPDRHVMALEQRKADYHDAMEIRGLLGTLDVDCTGSIGWDEFSSIANDPEVEAMLSVMGLDIKDAGLVFKMLCDTSGSDEVELDSLLDACMKMRGPATSLDLQVLGYRTGKIGAQLATLQRHVKASPH